METHYYYSPSTHGFYIDGISNLKPDDCVIISEDLYNALLTGQSEGKIIAPPDDTSPLPYLRMPSPLTPEEQQTEFTAAIQRYLDAFAQTRNYDSIMSAATYATSTVPRFKAEGQYAIEARDAVWAKGYAILDDVLSGARPMPTNEEVIAELPPLVWPEGSRGYDG